MPKVRLMLFSLNNANFTPSKEVDFDDDDWAEMSREDRQALIDEEGEQFLKDTVEWDYRVL